MAAIAIPDGYRLVPIVPTAVMLDAADRAHADALRRGNAGREMNALWAAMLAVAPDPTSFTSETSDADTLQGLIVHRNKRAGRGDADHLLATLPPLGTMHRNPDFWSDLDVRQMVIATHRQMTVQQARTAIAGRFGADRTPSKSALGRAWKRLDIAKRKTR